MDDRPLLDMQEDVLDFGYWVHKESSQSRTNVYCIVCGELTFDYWHVRNEEYIASCNDCYMEPDDDDVDVEYRTVSTNHPEIRVHATG